MNDAGDIFSLLPDDIHNEAVRLGVLSELEEIRLRTGLPVSFTARGCNFRADRVLTSDELDYIFCLLTCGSFYSHEQTISHGFIIYKGTRIGVAGDFTAEGALKILYSLNIRIPKPVSGVSALLCEKIQARSDGGMLIYSPPGVGKTTLLRDLAVRLSSPPILKRVVICDERGELFDRDLMRPCLLDALTGLKKAEAIELATRSLSPEYIICDEIGGYDEAKSLLSAQNTGVPLICSAHASNLNALLRRPNIALLHEARVFALYCRVERDTNNIVKFNITERDEC